VQGLSFGVWVSRFVFRVRGSDLGFRFRVWGVGCGVYGCLAKTRATALSQRGPRRRCGPGSGFRVQVVRFRVSGFGFRVPGSGFRVSGFEFLVSGAGFIGLGFGVWELGSGCLALVI